MDNNKTEILRVRITPLEQKVILKKAKAHKMKISEYARWQLIYK